MDGARFDRLARGFARPGTRRAAVARLAALLAIAEAPRTIGAQAPGGLGAACSTHGACAAVDPAAGWATCRAGACCLVRGSRCAGDVACCDGLPCLAPGVCGGVGASGLPPGAWCPSGGNACSPHPFFGPVSTVCADNGVWEDGPTNCCFPVGGLCSDDAHCCAELVCGGGVCG